MSGAVAAAAAAAAAAQQGGEVMLEADRVFRMDIYWKKEKTEYTEYKDERELVVEVKNQFGKKEKVSLGEGIKQCLPPNAKVLQTTMDYYWGRAIVYYTR